MLKQGTAATCLCAANKLAARGIEELMGCGPRETVRMSGGGVRLPAGARGGLMRHGRDAKAPQSGGDSSVDARAAGHHVAAEVTVVDTTDNRVGDLIAVQHGAAAARPAYHVDAVSGARLEVDVGLRLETAEAEAGGREPVHANLAGERSSGATAQHVGVAVHVVRAGTGAIDHDAIGVHRVDDGSSEDRRFMPMSSRSRGRTAIVAAAAAICATVFTAHAGASAGSPSPAGQTQRPSAALLRIPFPQDDGSLTPYTFDLGYSLMTLVYDTVMWRDANGVPRPWLADSVTTSPDGLTVTIHVAPAATWQDGLRVTSADIAFTFAYVAAHPHARFTPEVEAVTGVDAPDTATAVVHLSHRSAGFDEEPLSDVPILPQHLWAGLPAGAVAPQGLPVGSGPYRMAAYTSSTGYRFEAVSGYFRGAPAVKTIDVPIIRDAATTISALEHGTVDALPDNLNASQVDQLRQDLGIRVETGDAYAGTVLLLNTRVAPFDNATVRSAVADSLDLPQLAVAVGLAVPATRGYLHPVSGWAPADDVQHYDAAAARSVLSRLGGTVTVLVPDNDPSQQETGRLVVGALQRAGLDARERSESVASLDGALGLTGEDPTYQLAISSSPQLAAYDPGLLARLFGSGQPLNITGYASPAFDADAASIGAAPDASSRRAAAARAVAQIATDAPVVPLYFPKGEFAVRPSVYDGWVFTKGSGILDKLSFVEPTLAHPGGAFARGGGDASSSGGSADVLFSPIAAVLALAAVTLAGYGALRWLRRV